MISPKNQDSTAFNLANHLKLCINRFPSIRKYHSSTKEINLEPVDKHVTLLKLIFPLKPYPYVIFPWDISISIGAMASNATKIE